jgi:hypothetical protein
MKAAEHAVAHEELMASLDGELPADRQAAVHAHVRQCDACARLLSELRQVSRDAALWQIDEAPASLAAPVVPVAPPVRRWGGFRPWQLASLCTAGLVVVLLGPLALREPPSPLLTSQASSPSRNLSSSAPPAHAAEPQTAMQVPAQPGLAGLAEGGPAEAQGGSGGAPPAPGQASPAGPLVVRNARLTMVATDFEAARQAVDRLLREVGGYVGQIQVTGTAAPRTLDATLRVPSARLDDVLTSLRQFGRVSHEWQSGDDVTDQVRDLDARLANARNTEARLNDILRRRTGNVRDILEVEREVARVRGEIERLAGERADIGGRIAFATLALRVTEEQQATLGLGPLAVSARFRNAFVDGVRFAFESVLEVSLAVLRVGPVGLLWVLVLWWPGRLLVRTWRKGLS